MLGGRPEASGHAGGGGGALQGRGGGCRSCCRDTLLPHAAHAPPLPPQPGIVLE